MVKISHPLTYLASAVTLLCPLTLQAATVASSGYSVSTKIDNNPPKSFTSSTDLIVSQQTMEFNQNKGGDIRAAATAMAREDNHTGNGTFRFYAGDIAESDSRPSGWADDLSNDNGPFGGADANVGALNNTSEKATVEAGANTTFTVTFNLAAGEVRRANFFLDYTIEISGSSQEANVFWNLTWDGNANWLGLSGSDSKNTPEYLKTSSTGLQTAILDQAGTYTLTLASEIPDQTFNNQNKTASATLDAVYFEVVAVPEPSSTGLLALGLSSVLFRRRR